MVECFCPVPCKLLRKISLAQVLLTRRCASLQSKTHYQILGIKQTADGREIKAAYIAQCKKYHPDLNPGDSQSQQKFVRLQEAYLVLNDPKERARYNRQIYMAYPKSKQWNSVHHKQETTDYNYWQRQGTEQGKYGQWSSQARQQEDLYGQWARQRRKPEKDDWIKQHRNSTNHGDRKDYPHHHHAFNHQKLNNMLGPFAFLVDAFIEHKQSSEATFQDIFLVFTLINVFTFFMCLSGIYMLKEITYITKK
ncbi:dnaJ homolog subfamily B member 9-like [Ostrea edulis]|uniref:dnaJ homolog subfamily B member 9-like n=1 Tax=Ostrea edulis TaxID=37623 RepID=UPI0024AF9BB4|nr:dnaJ homolog subfamily B member 9-like [Ostrea edulis]